MKQFEKNDLDNLTHILNQMKNTESILFFNKKEIASVDLIWKKMSTNLIEKEKSSLIQTRNILEEANDIVFNRNEEKDRKYGPFSDSIARAARVATEICNKEITTEDFFKCMIALKISRLAYNHKHDTMLDILGYTAGLDTYLKERKEVGCDKYERGEKYFNCVNCGKHEYEHKKE